MNEERFEKVVEGDEEYLSLAWMFGLGSLVVPLIPLFISYNGTLSFLDIVLAGLFDGVSLLAFVISIIKYEDSRKVYWRKMK